MTPTTNCLQTIQSLRMLLVNKFADCHEDLPIALRQMIDSDGETAARNNLRAANRKSIYFLTKTTICYAENPNLMTPRTFKQSCDWLQRNIVEEKRGLFEDPRDHIKSYRSTVSIPIWLAVQRPHLEFDAQEEMDRASRYLDRYPNMHGVDTRIVIASETQERARDWVAQSKSQWMVNPVLMWLFPELLWKNYNTLPAPARWKDVEYFLPGRVNPTRPDGFCRAIGITTAESGGRADVILIDDLTSEKSADSPTEMSYRCRWFRSITQLLDHRDPNDAAGGSVMLITNRWGFDDPNSVVHDTMSHWKVWHRAAWVCGIHGRGNCGRLKSDDEYTICTPTEESLWPEKHPDLDIIRADLGDSTFYIQWGNAPARKADFDLDKIVPFDLEPRLIQDKNGQEPVRKMCAVVQEYKHPISGELVAKAATIPINSLVHHYISIDPAGADDESIARKLGKTARWACSWYALDPATQTVFCLGCEADHWGPSDAIEHCYNAWRTASDFLGERITILSEKVGAQSLVKTALHLCAQRDGIPSPNVELLAPQRGPGKDNSIRQSFGYKLDQHRVYLRRGLLVPRTEVRHFPTGSKDWLDTFRQVMIKYIELSGVVGKTRNSARRIRARKRARANAGITGAW